MPRRTTAIQKWSMYQALDKEVSRLLEPHNLRFKFNKVDDTKDCVNEYDTNIMGHFRCKNSQCSTDGWSSKKIAVTIRMYKGNLYNARVYHQRCKNCNCLSRPHLDGSYTDRVVYRLKKWSGVEIERPPYLESKDGPPHESHLCEGCKSGHCANLQLF